MLSIHPVIYPKCRIRNCVPTTQGLLLFFYSDWTSFERAILFMCPIIDLMNTVQKVNKSRCKKKTSIQHLLFYFLFYFFNFIVNDVNILTSLARALYKCKAIQCQNTKQGCTNMC